MSELHDALDEAIRSVSQLRKVLGRVTGLQVRNEEERLLVKATALAWFRQHQPVLRRYHSIDPAAIDRQFGELMEASERASSRRRYLGQLDVLRTALIQLRTKVLAERPAASDGDEPPDFGPLITDAKMQAILRRRWTETRACISARAHLAAIVMMGGLLEGLFLARVNQLTERRPVFTATSAPKDKNQKTLPLGEWVLKNYIEVGHELEWIGRPAKDVGEVLRDYRNYIHPAKELSHGVMFSDGDTDVLWRVFTSLAGQLIRSAATL